MRAWPAYNSKAVRSTEVGSGHDDDSRDRSATGDDVTASKKEADTRAELFGTANLVAH